MKRYLITFTVLFILVWCPNGAVEADLNVSTFKLPNGLRIILSPTDDIQATCVLVYHKNGTRDDPVETRGASYLYQFFMRMGTRHLEPYDRFMLINKNGGFTVERVNVDNSYFYHVIPDHMLNNALWLESERIGSLKLTDTMIESQKNSIYRRISRLMDTNINYRATEWVKSRIFEGTVYLSPLHGELTKIRNFDSAEVKKLYANFRDISDIIMVVAGKFDPENLRESIIEHFPGSSPKKNKMRRKYVPAKPRTEYVYKNWMIEGLPQHFVAYGVRAPSKLIPDHLTFDVIRYYLVDKRISQLARNMNIINDLNVNISYEYTDNIESNAFIVTVSSPDRITVEKVKYIMNAQFRALRNAPMTGAALKSVKSLMELDFRKDLAKLDRRSLILAEYFHLFGTINVERAFIRRLKRITPFDIRKVSNKYLKKENLVVLNVYKK